MKICAPTTRCAIMCSALLLTGLTDAHYARGGDGGGPTGERGGGGGGDDGAVRDTPDVALPKMPYWTAPKGDARKTPGLAGYSKIKSEFNAAVYYGSLEDNHAVMMTLFNNTVIVSWKNAPVDEDTPGQRVLWSVSSTGREWSKAAVLFPNMSTVATPAAQFAGPFAVINGRLYATGTPAVISAGDAQGAQWCLWPDGLDPRNCATPDRPGSQPTGLLMMRQILDVSTMETGRVFWASRNSPAVYAAAAAANNVARLEDMDPQTIADVATLTPTMDNLPCDTMHGTLKCEGCVGGCHLMDTITPGQGIANEKAHYPITQPTRGGASDVILYRSHASALYASVRIDGKTQSNWSDIALTNIPNDDSNINAGVLPEENGVFLVANGVPARVRDPVTLSISQDGLNWSSCRVAQTCTDFPEIPKSTCKGRYAKNGNVGPSYPQALSVVDPAPKDLQGLYVASTNNKEDVVITKMSWTAVLGSPSN